LMWAAGKGLCEWMVRFEGKRGRLGLGLGRNGERCALIGAKAEDF